jgi:hypothetical protein
VEHHVWVVLLRVRAETHRAQLGPGRQRIVGLRLGAAVSKPAQQGQPVDSFQPPNVSVDAATPQRPAAFAHLYSPQCWYCSTVGPPEMRGSIQLKVGMFSSVVLRPIQ